MPGPYTSPEGVRSAFRRSLAGKSAVELRALRWEMQEIDRRSPCPAYAPSIETITAVLKEREELS